MNNECRNLFSLFLFHRKLKGLKNRMIMLCGFKKIKGFFLYTSHQWTILTHILRNVCVFYVSNIYGNGLVHSPVLDLLGNWVEFELVLKKVRRHWFSLVSQIVKLLILEFILIMITILLPSDFVYVRKWMNWMSGQEAMDLELERLVCFGLDLRQKRESLWDLEDFNLQLFHKTKTGRREEISLM